ncbi:zinc-binding protein A33-like [Lissotriton helveticus]
MEEGEEAKEPQKALAVGSVVHVDDLTEELTCSVCLELFRDPVILPCGHNFCRVCIDGSCEGEGSCSCPICRAEFESGRYTPIAALANLVERVSGAIVDGKECGERCSKEQCKVHQEKLKLFCKDDGVLACVICRYALKHANHSFLPIQDAGSMYRDQLIVALEPLKTTLHKFQDVKKEQEALIQHQEWDTLNVKSAISLAYDKLHKALKDQKAEMLNEIQSHYDANQKTMKKHLAMIAEDCEKIQNTLDEAESRLKEQDSLEFLKGIKSCSSNCSSEEKRSVPGVSKYRSLYQEPEIGLIEYIIWKKLRSTISPAPSLLTLDHETAHDDLVLSEDRTSVQYRTRDQHLSTIGQLQSSCCSLKSFAKEVAVLGTEGFTSGKHYWEVDVGKSSAWILGVVPEPLLSGKGALQFGTNYALQLKGGKTYETLEYPPRVLPLTCRPQKIGIFVDFENRHISFLNADDMSLLHTFSFFPFTKLFPYFQPSVDAKVRKHEALIICH